MQSKNKEQLIEWFSQMREIESTAKDMYFGIAENPEVADEEIKNAFRKVSEDEGRHAQIVQKIINIINGGL